MGNCITSNSSSEVGKAIDRELRVQNQRDENVIKTLLLGAGESGKSTLVKQMKIIHGDGYSRAELTEYIPTVHVNLIHALRNILRNMGNLGVEFADPNNKKYAEDFVSFEVKYARITEDLSSVMKSIWKDSGVKECYTRAYEYEHSDNAQYYLSEVDRILSPDYVPTELDILRTRVQTTGIIETNFRLGKSLFRVVDVGGQRSERRKWIQTFDDVTSLWFVCALSGYDTTLFEDGSTNRLEEALNLFQAICNNKFLVKSTTILFLNKLDVFQDKIMNSDRHLRLYLPQYTGEDRNVEQAAEFIKSEFMERNLNKNKTVYTHFTTATDTSNIKVVMTVVADTILRERIEAVNLL